MKLIRIAFTAFIIIATVILIKYKPQYEVSINGEEIGHIDSQSDIDKYIEETVKAEEDKNDNTGKEDSKYGLI